MALQKINIDRDTTKPIADFCKNQGWVPPDTEIISIRPAGEGNMNTVKRALLSDGTSLVLKQAFPFVKKYPSIPAPVDRLQQEAFFYAEVQTHQALKSTTPNLIGYDEHTKILALEYIDDAEDFSFLWSDNNRSLTAEEKTKIVSWLSALHNIESDALDKDPNLEMRKLNHEHIFIIPLRENNGVSLEESLKKKAKSLRQLAAVQKAAKDLGEIYLSDQMLSLIHGDFHPGSWMRTKERGPVIIDPEFSFCGRGEFDLGILEAHLFIKNQDLSEVEEVLQNYNKPSYFDDSLVSGFRSFEIIRRLLGVAQLPLTRDEDFKIDLLDFAVDTLRSH